MISNAHKSYYNQRAAIYEKIYEKPERQTDLLTLTHELQNRFTQHHVLEIACGTGYWTERIGKRATSILAVDQSAESLAIARTKNLQNVRFLQDDAYLLSQITDKSSASFSGFWWSHIPNPRRADFLENLHTKLLPGATVTFIDNNYVEGSNYPTTRTDADGNTYQTRPLPDGSHHEILKNFPNDDELQQAVQKFTANVAIKRLTYFWIMQYNLAR